MVPAVGAITVAIQFKRVDLPDPLLPIMPRNSPSPTEKEMSFRKIMRFQVAMAMIR